MRVLRTLQRSQSQDLYLALGAHLQMSNSSCEIKEEIAPGLCHTVVM